MRHPDHRRLRNSWKGVEKKLDLLRVHVEAARNDEVLRAPDEREVAICVKDAAITGPTKTVGRELLGVLFGLSPVAGQHVRAPHLHVAWLACGQSPTVLA